MLDEAQIKKLINEDYNSQQKRKARVAQRYYDGKHDILKYKMYYYNKDGELIEDTTRSNIKISHPFFTELVDQCVQYMLSSKEPIVKSSDVELQKLLNKYFGSAFKTELSDTLTDTCIGGVGWIYAYKNKNDITSFVYATASGVVDVRAKDTDDKCEYKIYWYIDRIENNKTIKRIQVWDKKQVTYYMQKDNGAIVKDDNETINPRPHIVYSYDGEEGRYGDSLGYIPFFPVYSNRKQTSHLAPIKAIIDDYDLMACGLSNNLQDVAEALYVVKGFKGDNLDELIQNTKQTKHVGVSADGDVDIKTINLPYDARKQKLDIDKENIYHFGMGFDATQVGDGNITNIVLLSRYALLELKCNKLQPRVEALLNNLISVVLDEINEQNGISYTTDDVEINLERELMTNAADNANIEKTKAETVQIKVNTLLNAAAQLDNNTILKELCEFLEIDYEEVKDNLSNEPNVDINAASTALAEAEIEDDIVE